MSVLAGSPAQCGDAAKTFRNENLLDSIHIRIPNTESGYLLFKIGQPPTADNYDYILYPNEALSITKAHANNGSLIYVLNGGGADPLFCWHQH